MTPFLRAVPRVLLAAVATLGAFACRQEKPRPPAATGRTRSLLAAHYQPPPDGLLTDRHLELYAKVRRAARDRSESDAARALGVDPDEFAWVRARLVEALVALDSTRVRDASAQTYTHAIASLRESLKKVRDPKTARTMEAQIAALERERAGLRQADPLPAALAANTRKVAARRAEIEATAR